MMESGMGTGNVNSVDVFLTENGMDTLLAESALDVGRVGWLVGGRERTWE